jgi:hypothetical protein
MIQSRRLRWTGHVARIREKVITYIEFLWESQRERDHYEDQDVSGQIILKWILEG